MRTMTLPECLESLPGRVVLTARDRLLRYELPERGEPGHTDYALLPENEEEVGTILSLVTRARLPIVVSAGRTGLVEAQRPDGEGVLSLERLTAPLAFHLPEGGSFEFPQMGDGETMALYAWWESLGRPSLAGATLEVQAGMSVDAVNAIIEPLGLLWPMEMGSSSTASVGACVANASAGANAICYGTAGHLCDAAWGYWADGGPAGPFAGPHWHAPRTTDLAIDSTRVQSGLGLIGSQGVFGVITRVRLRLYPRPAAREGVLVPVSDMPTAIRLLQAAKSAFGDDLEEFEFMGRAAIELVMAHIGGQVQFPLPDERVRDWCVMLQVKGGDGTDLAERLYTLLGEVGVADEDIGYAPLSILKQIRHSITEASNRELRIVGGGRLSFDTAVPVVRFGDYLETLSYRLSAEWPAVRLIAFGHAGVGGAHLHLIGSGEQPVNAHVSELVGLVFDVTGAYGGTFSAEHGVGPKWGVEYVRRMPREVVEHLRREKKLRDPAGILNPRSFGLLG